MPGSGLTTPQERRVEFSLCLANAHLQRRAACRVRCKVLLGSCSHRLEKRRQLAVIEPPIRANPVADIQPEWRR
jgi:hypothetical protein